MHALGSPSYRVEDTMAACCRALGLEGSFFSTPTAIFAVNDNTAIGAMSALRRLDLAIPEDVSLVGYNDIPIVSRLGTPMTTVRVPFDQIAAAALDLLTHGAEGTQAIRVATPTLIPRRSTAAPPRP